MVDTPTKSDVEKAVVRFEMNLIRVNELLRMAKDDHVRQSYLTNDILRAAVVLLHASLEDTLRTLLLWKLPQDEKHLDAMCFERVKGNRRPNITLLELATYKEKTVAEVIGDAIKAHCYERSFNHPQQIMDAVETLGLDKLNYWQMANALKDMIERRHEIVHNSDRPPGDFSSHGKPVPIDHGLVNTWRQNVYDFGHALLVALGGYQKNAEVEEDD